MKRSLALFIISSLLISSIKCLNVDPCKRQPFRGRCPVSANGIQARSQFVLRYYLRNGECVSYPYGHCANDENEPKLFRYKEECQEACIGKRETESISNDDKDSPIRFSPIKPSTPGYGKSQETYETNKPLITTSSSKILTECEKQRMRNKEIFKLECDIDGSYKSLQCNAEKQECFCVDETGKEIPYSRSSPNGVAPDCTAIAKTEGRLFNKCTGNAVYGPCKANLTRWYFDESENKCKSFEYSGCGSNGNNYENELACKDRCMPKKPITSSEDESQTTVSQVDRNTICSLPKERGPCDRYDLRFYYNKDLNECKYFFYGGCEGNSNNFLKVEDCEATCGGKPIQIKDLPPKNPIDVTPEPKIIQTIPKKNLPIETSLSPRPLSTTTEYPFTENRCLPPKDSGNCNGNYVRWYWNNERKICESFSYSGCSGNSNNFANREECLSICHINATPNFDENEKLDQLDVCSHKIDPGDCGGNFIRWAFDKKSRNCIKMRYTGCTGNGNNFANEEDCIRKCIPSRKPVQQSSACFHPIDVGDCDGVFPRFGYDKNTNECKQYTYSGCNGSPNNFGSLQDCAEACIRTRCPPITNCDTTHCRIVQDRSGCQSCACQPIIDVKPAIISPPFPIQPPPISKCPIIDVALCVEPCMIFSNRIGCQECVCPKVPMTEKAFVKPPTSSEILHTSQKPLITINKTTFKPSVQSPSFVSSTRKEDYKIVKNDSQFKDIVGDKCTLPVDPGPCKDFIERWYFNINTGLCESFKYGGCGGSKNHFFTRHECEVHCARFSRLSSTSLPDLKQTGLPQKTRILPQQKFEKFPQSTIEDIVDICNLPSDTGHCLNYVSRWYFNSQRGKCEQFSYGSCGGNKNNFFDRNSCEAKCSSVILPRVLPSLPKECTFEKHEGFGGGYHPKYYFNFRNLHCEQMIYQGQGGNDNRFDNKIKCENTCINKIHESDNEFKPFPILQPPLPNSKSEKNVSDKDISENSITINAKGTKTVQSIDREGQTGKPTETKEILTENPELTVTVPSLDDYKKNYNPMTYQNEKNNSPSEGGQEIFRIQTTNVPENGGYPETSLIPSQPIDSIKLLQTTTISTTTGYETAESIKEKEVKPSTTKNEIETIPYEIETTTNSKNIEPSNINKEEVEEVKTFQPDVSTLSTTSPIYVSTIGFELEEFNGKDVTNTIPTIKITTYTDTPETEKQTITLEHVESYTEPHIISSTVQSQTNTQTQPIETTKGQTESQPKTEDINIILSSPVPPSIPPSVKIGANLIVEGNVPSPFIKTEIVSNITEINNVTSGNGNIKKLDIRKLSTISTTKNIPTESIIEKTTIKLEIPTTQEVDKHSQSNENDKDLLDKNIIQRKDIPDNKNEYIVNKIVKILTKNAPKEQLPIVKESPDPTLDYQHPGGNVVNGIINRKVDKDSETLEEFPSIIDPRIPVCPNKKPALLDDRLGHPLSCLPGKRPCPEKSSCIFNGVNFYCCPSPEDPYDHHVFGGYNGEEIKNGYKPLSKTLNILSISNHEPITRAKRESMGLENVYKSLRFEGAPIRQVSRANRLHVNGKMLPICSLEVERGNCDESHVRYFYDARIDQCRMFYYSGCHGNGNNFASQLDCERICKIQDNENLKISKQQKSFTDICGEGKIPFGGENPLVCGTENDSIGCPVGYSCRKEAPFICCPKVVEDNDDSNQLTIKEIIAKKTNKDTRFAPKPNPTYNPYKSNLPRLRTSSGIVVASSSNICPDGSDSLKEVITEKPVDCGTGGDGHPLCPIGYYCSIDSFTNSRLCCQLGSVGTKLYAPVNESPFVSQRKNNSKESFKKDELPVSSDVSSTTPKFSKPLPLSIPSILEKKKTNGEYNRMMLKPINKGNNQRETFLEENPKLQFDDTEETDIKQPDDSSIFMVDEIGMLEQKKKIDKTACQISYSEGRACREDEPVPRTNLQYFYSVKEKKCKIFFYRGCGGSINRFESKKDCETLCMME